MTVLAAALIAVGCTDDGPGAAPAPAPSTVAVPLPAASLAPGSYEVLIRGSGTELATTIVVPSGPPAATEPAGQPDGSAWWLLLVVLLVTGGGAAFVLARRGGAPGGASALRLSGGSTRRYHELLAMLDAGEYARVLPELTRLEGTLPDRLRDDARFFIAFAQYQLGDLDPAEHLLATLHRESPDDREVGYLLAYVRTDRRNFDGAAAVLEAVERADRLDGDRIRRLYSVVTYQRAAEALRDGRVREAADLFEKVDRLGGLPGQVPADLRGRHALLGVQALLSKETEAARRHFQALDTVPADAEAADSDEIRATAQLGLALADWIEFGSARADAINRHLNAVLRNLAPDAPTVLEWTDPTEQLTERLAGLAARRAKAPEQAERDRTLRDVHLLRAMLILRYVADLDGVDVRRRDRYLDLTLGRLACARELDPEFADVYIVAGMLGHHLTTGPAEAEWAAALLSRARQLGARDPELIRALKHLERRAPTTRDDVDLYLQELDRFIHDPVIRQQVRHALAARMARYGKFPDWEVAAEPEPERAATLPELVDRAELHAARLDKLIAAAPDRQDRANLEELARLHDQRVRELATLVRTVETAEADLLAGLGDLLLDENGR
ncbi:tetratricopeptide repeat protein [Virgisporangium aurantiacum]|uniref:Tetratricopeptide repeat-containing protein n=1 Tax=Virgisporangium aurantiacum TaxID=175570 RepID=A0A8J3ZEU5_9ACTN|nr:tetratricopeptide repeat protein [Virgisporangium aurantiacum]GIJ60306.1 hypothetical protein Vau01_078220 [Virgisporangium aurantiacum]